MASSKNPFQAFLAIRRQELPLALLMFAYFFLVITTFWILKPIKKTAFIGYYRSGNSFDLLGGSLSGPQAEMIAKVANMGVAVLAVIAFSRLARTLRRQQLSYVFSGFCAVCMLAFVVLGAAGGELYAWLFYLFGDFFNTVMVATFFAFLNDSVRPETAKRTYGVIVLGGVAGGAFGTTVVKLWISSLSVDQWLLICVGLTAVIVGVAAAAGAQVAKHPPPERDQPVSEAEPKGNAAVDGARLVFRSRYLLAIVTIVGLYEIVSTVLDFQYTSAVVHLVAADQQDAHFATVYNITNVLSLAVQLLLTSLIMQKVGVRAALLFMPLAILGSSAGFLILPILWMGSALSIADNGLNYSLNQSARESLYTPTSRDEKYKAKAFIDMFVQRFAKALAVGVSLLVSTQFGSFGSLRYLSIFVIVLVAIWLYAAWYAGGRFAALEQEDAA